MSQQYEIVGDDKLWDIPSDWTHGGQYGQDGCHRCGQRIFRNTITAQVHVVAGGGTLLSAEYGINKFSQYDDESEHEEAGGDMYWFPIGSECKKHVPAEFVSEPQS